MEVQLQRKDDQIQQQGKELQEQQRELQTLRVRKWTFSAIYMYEDIMITPVCTLVVRRTKEDCRQRWMVKFSNKPQNRKKRPFNSADNRESYKH